MPKTNRARWVGVSLLALGLSALTLSILYESTLLAFIGLGLTFWGSLLLYIQPERHVRQTLLEHTVTPALKNLDQIMEEFKYEGQPVYLPPKYFKAFGATKVYIPKTKDAILPAPQEIQEKEDKTFLKNPDAILITPPGLSLSKLFEDTLQTTFTKVDLEYLQRNLPKLLIEDLEIAEHLEIQAEYHKVAQKLTNSISLIQLENNTIQAKIKGSVYHEVGEKTQNLPHIYHGIGCPLSSAIACALTKATGNPITIQKIQLQKDQRTTEAHYKILEAIEPEEPTEATAPAVQPPRSRLPTFASLSLTALGSIILGWIGGLIWYDITVWGKDVTLILFGSRIDEVISLGIDMKAIHYLLIGLASLITGLTAYLRIRRRRS